MKAMSMLFAFPISCFCECGFSAPAAVKSKYR
jgi:hypothetical protein